MPNRNIIKNYSNNSIYHIYNRGVEKRKIFLDDEDYATFLYFIKRHLGEEPILNSEGRSYEWLSDELDILAFCLMPNHFHLLIYQYDNISITRLIRAICSSYVAYFNSKYKRVGSLFQGTYKALRILDDDHLVYISRYIHRNPSKYLDWKWSSLDYWIGNKDSFWINPQKINNMSPEKYLEYIKDDDDYKNTLDDIKDDVF